MGGKLADYASKFNKFNDFTAGSENLENSPERFNSMGWTAGKEFFSSFGNNDYFTPIRQLGPGNGSFGFYYDSKNGRYQAAYKDTAGNLIKDQEIPDSILDQLSDNDIAKIFEKGGYNQNAYEENFSKLPYSDWEDAAKRLSLIHI